MRRVLVLGDGAAPAGISVQDSKLELTTVGPNPNVRLQTDVYRTKFLRELPKRHEDLLRLAAFVYAADNRVSRGGPKDVFADRWQRTFQMVLPVWDLEFWSTLRV